MAVGSAYAAGADQSLTAESQDRRLAAADHCRRCARRRPSWPRCAGRTGSGLVAAGGVGVGCDRHRAEDADADRSALALLLVGLLLEHDGLQARVAIARGASE